MSSLADRVNQRMQHLALRQADVARLSQVRPASVAQWRNGRTKNLSGDTLLRAASALQCSPKWLATGIGSVEQSPTQQAHSVSEPDPWQLSAAEQQMLSIFKGLPAAGQAEALNYLKYLSSQHPSTFNTTGSQQRDQIPGATKRAA